MHYTGLHCNELQWTLDSNTKHTAENQFKEEIIIKEFLSSLILLKNVTFDITIIIAKPRAAHHSSPVWLVQMTDYPRHSN